MKYRVIIIFAALIAGISIMLHVMNPGGLPNLVTLSPQLPETAPVPPTPAAPVVSLPVSVGDLVSFGRHNWRVLDVQDTRVLLISERIVGFRMFHSAFSSVTWETSEMRQYLNGEFLDTFTEAEQELIIETLTVNSNNPWDFVELGGFYRTPGGSDTIDRVFLLSIDEVLHFFGDSGLVAEGAEMNAVIRNNVHVPGLQVWGIHENNHYSEARIAFDYAGIAYWWWLRSPGYTSRFAASVSQNGGIYMGGRDVFNTIGQHGGVRPAMWLDLEI